MLNIVKKKFVIELSTVGFLILASAAAIILVFGYTAVLAMFIGNGNVIFRFNEYGEGWTELLILIAVTDYLFYKIFVGVKYYEDN